ncbi:MAG: hypothetical protein JOY99_05440 [Sphingomonadaceae bacterium]|nr:hypothetical protein [Sphingomonadaceae bacterium]
MKLDGSIVSNLQAALASARRFRDKPVYPDTLNHWRNVLSHAHYLLGKGQIGEINAIRNLSSALGAELEQRKLDPDKPHL